MDEDIISRMSEVNMSCIYLSLLRKVRLITVGLQPTAIGYRGSSGLLRAWILQPPRVDCVCTPGVIDQIKAKPDLWFDKGAKMIKQNATSLLNDILDLRKLEFNAQKLNMVHGVPPFFGYVLSLSGIRGGTNIVAAGGS